MKIILILLFCFNIGLTQNTIIRGNVVNQYDNKPIGYVNISVEGTFKGTFSDLNGNFKIELPHGKYVLDFYHVSFYRKALKINAENKDTIFIKIRLKEKTEELGVINVEAHKEEGLSKFTLNPISIKNLPALGEPDVLRTIGMLPGITLTNDYKLQPSINGGAPDQTEYILDGVEVFYPEHLRGLFSAFNLWAIDEVNVYTANFPAKYYGRLSGIIEMNTPKGNFMNVSDTLSKKIHANISLLTTSFTSQFQWHNSFVAIAGRRTYLDLISALASHKIPYYFYDTNIKWEQKLNKKWKSSLSFFANNDKAKFETSTLSWGNKFFRLELTNKQKYYYHEFFISTSEYFSNSVGKNKINNLSNGIFDNSIRYEVRKNASKNISLFGAEFKHLSIKHSWNLSEELNVEKLLYRGAPHKFSKSQKANLFRTYFSNSFIFRNKFLLSVKFDCILFNLRKSYSTAGLSLDYKLNNKNRLFFSIGKNYQFIAAGSQGIEWSLNSPLFLLVSPINDLITTFGFHSQIIPGILTKIEVYNKKFGSIVRMDNSIKNYPKLEYGIGKAIGLNFLIEKRTGRITFQLGYSLLNNVVKFNGLTYHPDWYIPNALKGSIGFRFGKTWLFTSAVTYRSGLLYYKPSSSFFSAGSNGDYEYDNFDFNRLHEHFIIEKYPTARFNPYFRLDLSLKKEYVTKYLKWYLYIQVLNVTNHSNPLRVNWVNFYSNGVGSAEKGYVLNLPLLPSVGAEFIF